MALRLTGSILIYGASNKQRYEKAEEIIGGVGLEISENNPDILTVEPEESKKSIGIDQIREVINFLSEKPFSNKYKAVVILKSERLTVPAQNALLKTLEEPPSFGLILLLAKAEDSLLETIQSRCRKILCRPKPTKENKEEMNLSKLISLKTGERLTWVSEFAKKDRERVIETLENWVVNSREKGETSTKTYRAIENTAKTAKDLESTNINLKLALENLVINL